MFKARSTRTLLSSMAIWLQGKMGRPQSEPLKLS